MEVESRVIHKCPVCCGTKILVREDEHMNFCKAHGPNCKMIQYITYCGDCYQILAIRIHVDHIEECE